MNLKTLLLFSAIIFIVSILYEATFYTANSLLTDGKLDVAIFYVGVSLVLATVFVYFKNYFEANSVVRFLFLSFVLRIFLNPFFIYLKMKVGVVLLCKQIVPPSEEKVLIDLLVNTSYFILLILVLRFKLKDIFMAVALAFFAMMVGIFIPHRFFILN
ncbi:hypothetical protein [Chryseobacterium sp.]|uniref:hypothetical protein n=1 Tax=Chryseobacterium sp. TaxID=1871047 RepID=UPI00289CD961|nr:hypothetical protein [Chryseobacterium sp.]